MKLISPSHWYYCVASNVNKVILSDNFGLNLLMNRKGKKLMFFHRDNALTKCI